MQELVADELPPDKVLAMEPAPSREVAGGVEAIESTQQHDQIDQHIGHQECLGDDWASFEIDFGLEWEKHC